MFRRFGLGFINRSGVWFVQSVPESMAGREAEFQRLYQLWTENHPKHRFDLNRLLFLMVHAEQLTRDAIPGAIAEVGVYKGNSAAVLHAVMPDREMYLFDTFTGFDDRDLEDHPDRKRRRSFADTSVDAVRALVGDSGRIHFLPGRFPETAARVPDDLRFAFVHLDCDLYEPMRAGLEFFHPRLSSGGSILIHDYGSGGWPGVKRACDEFAHAVGARLVLLPDKAGSALLSRT